MRRSTLLLLSSIFLLAACSNQAKVPYAQTEFLQRLKRTQDTVEIFKNQAVLKERVITNMAKYVRASALTVTDWAFNVEEVTDSMVYAKTPHQGDSSVYGVKFALLMPETSAVREQVSQLKPGDVVKVDGEMAMKTADGKISMNPYFASEDNRVIKLVPTAIKQ